MGFWSNFKKNFNDFGNGMIDGFKYFGEKGSRALGDIWLNMTGQTAKMEWEKNMSDTAHQREVADMKAAGLNPVMSAGGGGASSPSAPSGGGDPLSAILGLIGTAAKVMNSSANLIKANTDRQLATSGYKSFRKYK